MRAGHKCMRLCCGGAGSLLTGYVASRLHGQVRQGLSAAAPADQCSGPKEEVGVVCKTEEAGEAQTDHVPYSWRWGSCPTSDGCATPPPGALRPAHPARSSASSARSPGQCRRVFSGLVGPAGAVIQGQLAAYVPQWLHGSGSQGGVPPGKRTHCLLFAKRCRRPCMHAMRVGGRRCQLAAPVHMWLAGRNLPVTASPLW